MSDPRSRPEPPDVDPMEPPESATEPMPLPPPDDEPIDLDDERQAGEERPRVTSTDDLLGTPRGARSEDPRAPWASG